MAGNQKLLLYSIISTIICSSLVSICYFTLDPWLVYKMQSLGWYQDDLIKYTTYISTVLLYASPIIIFIIAYEMLCTTISVHTRRVLIIAISICISYVLIHFLKEVFARYWPATWIENNPSLLGSGAYGFNWFKRGVAYESFPSGHTATIFSCLSIVWLYYKKTRWLFFVLAICEITALIIMRYHFLSDILSGALVGSLTGLWMAYFFRLDRDYV